MLHPTTLAILSHVARWLRKVGYLTALYCRQYGEARFEICHVYRTEYCGLANNIGGFPLGLSTEMAIHMPGLAADAYKQIPWLLGANLSGWTPDWSVPVGF